MIHGEPGAGTKSAAHLPDDPRANLVRHPAKSNVPRVRGERVLVVANDRAVRLSVIRALDELGYRHFKADDSRRAIALLQSHTEFELLVCDIDLPQLSGRRLAQIARARRPQLRVLLVASAERAVSDAGAIFEEGVQTVVAPFTLTSFACAVRLLIERSGSVGNMSTVPG